MERSDIEFHIDRIIASLYIINIDDIILYIKQPSKLDKYRANLVYQAALKDGDGLLSEDDLLILLDEQGIWTPSDEGILDGVIKDIDTLKVALYENLLNENFSRSIRTNLASAKDKIAEFLSRKHSFDHLTVSGYANLSRLRTLVSGAIYDSDDNKVEITDLPLSIDKVISEMSHIKLDEGRIRELARSDYWRTYWSAKDCGTLFSGNVTDWSDEQRSLVSISNFYDNIHESPDCPADAVINDDDLLDGWLIIQKRKRETDAAKNEIESRITNSKIAASQEIFIPVQGTKGVEAVESMNNEYARRVKAARLEKIRKEGSVNSIDFSDKQLEIQMRLNNR